MTEHAIIYINHTKCVCVVCRLAMAEYLSLILCLSNSTSVITAVAVDAAADNAHITEAVTSASITITGSTNIATTSLVSFMFMYFGWLYVLL